MNVRVHPHTHQSIARRIALAVVCLAVTTLACVPAADANDRTAGPCFTLGWHSLPPFTSGQLSAAMPFAAVAVPRGVAVVGTPFGTLVSQRCTTADWVTRDYPHVGLTAKGPSSNALAVRDGGVYVFLMPSVGNSPSYVSPDGDLHSLGGALTSDPAVAADSSGIAVFGIGTDDALWFQPSVGTSPGWSSLGGQLNSELAAVSAASNRYVIGRGLDDAYWYRVGTGANWSPWRSLGGEFPTPQYPGCATCPLPPNSPAVAPTSAGLIVSGIGNDGAVWVNQLVGSTWTGWSSLGGQTVCRPVAVTDSAGTYEFVNGLDRALWYRRLSGQGWTSWQDAGGSFGCDLDGAVIGNGTGAMVGGLGNDGTGKAQYLVVP